MTIDTAPVDRASLYSLGAYTQLTAAHFTNILAHYRVEDSEGYVSHRELTGGLSNSNYRLITTQRSLLVKVCDNKTVSELRTQVRALVRLSQCPGAPMVAYPVGRTDVQGEYLLSMPNVSKPVIVYDFLDGRPPAAATVSVMTQLAESLAQLHSMPVAEFRYLPPFPMGVAEIQPFLDRELATLSPVMQSHPFIPFLQATMATIAPILHSSDNDSDSDSKASLAIIHGDLFLENTIFTHSGDQLLGLIDFEDIAVGEAVIDVCMTIVGCCYNDNDSLDLSLTEAFLQRYQQQRPLSRYERESFPLYLTYALIAIAFWRFRQFNLLAPNEARKDSYLSMKRRIEGVDSAKLIALIDSAAAH